MYSKEEAKAIREKFWNQFKSWSGRHRIKQGKKGRWIMNETSIKQLRLKFHFDENYALACIEVDTRNLDKRIEIWEKLESLKKLLTQQVHFTIHWDLEYPVSDSKTTSRIYSKLNGVNIYNKNHWKQVNQFLYERMTVFEEFFESYKDVLKS